MSSNFADLYKSCVLCPHRCRANRTDSAGFCGEKDIPHLAWAGLHKGEEPPVSGENGSGMLFFRGCSLKCAYCQNYQINSSSFKCPEIDMDSALKIIYDMKNMGAETISFVTAEHFAPFVAEVCEKLKADDFSLPLVLNTSGWISAEIVKLLLPLIDIWLWDTKTHDGKTSSLFCGNGHYAEEEKKSFKFLFDNIAETDIENKKKGIIVRHLVFPSRMQASLDVVKDFVPFKDRCWFSLMKQFVEPCGSTLKKYSSSDYEILDRAVFDAGIENGFIQEYDENESDWIPDFKKDNPFPSAFAEPSAEFLHLKNDFKV